MNWRRNRGSRTFALLFQVYALPIVAIAVLIALKVFADIPIPYLTRDPWAIVEHPFYLGLYSNLNMVLWGMAFGALWLTVWTVRTCPLDAPMQSFFYYSAITTTILFFDDLFGFHDSIFPEHLHIPELLVYACYGLWILWYLWRFAAVIRRLEHAALLVSAIVFFGLSAIIDNDELFGRLPAHFVWEDGTKLLGVAGWCVYFVRVSSDHLRASMTAATGRVTRAILD